MENSSMDLNSSQALGRKIRLKHLLDEGIQIESRLAQQSSETTLTAIRRIINASDGIIEEGNVQDRAEHTTEVVMDAQVLKMNHELVSKVLQQTKDFSENVYHTAIASIIFQDDSVNWAPLTKLALTMAHTTRTKSTMLGAIDVEIKAHVAKERQKRRKTTLAEQKRPETVSKLQRQDKGAQKVNIVNEQLSQIFRANNRQPIPYYKLIIDPQNFMNTVENAFQMAFLARDNIIAIETGEDKYPQVRLVSAEERKVEQDNAQSICTLNLEKCREMILFYDIHEAMLKVEKIDEDETDPE